MNTDQLLAAILAGFTAEGYTPEQVTAFVQTSVRQMKLIVQQYELQALGAAQNTAISASQAAREAKQTEINNIEASILTLIAAQAQS